MKEKQILEMFNMADEMYIQEAASKGGAKKKRFVKSWMAVAACLCLVVGSFYAFSQKDITEEGNYYAADIKNVSDMYDGIILAEKLSYEDAYSTSIQLCYDGTGSVSNVDGWDSLSVSASYEDYDIDMECSFTGKSYATSGEAATAIQYGDTVVYFYKVEAGLDYDVSYKAVFEYENLVYELQTYSNDEKRILDIMETFLGTPTEISNILGYSNYYVRAEEFSPGHVGWKYYVDTNGTETCIAEVFGSTVPEPDRYPIDIDGDGINELICNCSSGTGAGRVYVYRNNHGVIEVGRLVYDTWDPSLFPGIVNHGSSYVQEKYNLDNGTIVISYAVENGEANIVLENFEMMEFHRFVEE